MERQLKVLLNDFKLGLKTLNEWQKVTIAKLSCGIWL